MRAATLLLIALAHAQPSAAWPAESDRVYSGDHTLVVGGMAFRVDDRSFRRGTELLAERLLSAPATDGRRVCAADEAPDGLGQLRCWGPSSQAVTMMVGGRPGRLAMAEGHVAWVASDGGLPHVFVAPADGAAAPRMLTNVGLNHVPGRPPAGFVAPPLRDSLRFDGDHLRWDAQDGAHAVRWR